MIDSSLYLLPLICFVVFCFAIFSVIPMQLQSFCSSFISRFKWFANSAHDRFILHEFEANIISRFATVAHCCTRCKCQVMYYHIDLTLRTTLSEEKKPSSYYAFLGSNLSIRRGSLSPLYRAEATSTTAVVRFMCHHSLSLTHTLHSLKHTHTALLHTYYY